MKMEIFVVACLKLRYRAVRQAKGLARRGSPRIYNNIGVPNRTGNSVQIRLLS